MAPRAAAGEHGPRPDRDRRRRLGPMRVSVSPRPARHPPSNNPSKLLHVPGDGTRGPEITSVSALKKLKYLTQGARGSGLLFFMFIRRPQPYTCLGIEWIFCIFRAPRGRVACAPRCVECEDRSPGVARVAQRFDQYVQNHCS